MADSALRVLYVIDNLDSGGAQSVLHNMVLHIKVWHPSVQPEVATLYGFGPFAQALIDSGVALHSLGMPAKYSLAGLARFVSFVRERSYDVIHAHLFPANYLTALSSLFVPKAAWVYTEHNAWNRRRQYPILRPLEAAVYDRFSAVIAVSALVAKSLTQWLPRVEARLTVIPNGVPMPPLEDGRRTQTARPQPASILFVGRLEQAKGVDVLLKALTHLRTADWRLHVVGEGSLRPSLEALAIQLGLRDKVQFLGFQPDVLSLMANAHCLVSPSRWEGLPLVVLEAMSVGLPVVASAVGGIPEVVEDGITGWLVRPEDPEELAGALESALTDSDKASEVSRNARMRVRAEYSIERMVQRTLDLYQEIMGSSR